MSNQGQFIETDWVMIRQFTRSIIEPNTFVKSNCCRFNNHSRIKWLSRYYSYTEIRTANNMRTILTQISDCRRIIVGHKKVLWHQNVSKIMVQIKSKTGSENTNDGVYSCLLVLKDTRSSLEIDHTFCYEWITYSVWMVGRFDVSKAWHAFTVFTYK